MLHFIHLYNNSTHSITLGKIIIIIQTLKNDVNFCIILSCKFVYKRNKITNFPRINEIKTEKCVYIMSHPSYNYSWYNTTRKTIRLPLDLFISYPRSSNTI